MEITEAVHFLNGSAYAMRLSSGHLIEVTDTFLPIDTKFCVNGINRSSNPDPGSRNDRWMIGVSCMSGCPVRCKFCATGQLAKCKLLTPAEIAAQVMFVLERHPSIDPNLCSEFKINYTRMGEPFLNLNAVQRAISAISAMFPKTHHYVSTIGLTGSDFSWIEGNTTLQISLHSLDEDRRHELIPFGHRLMSIRELGMIRTNSNLKTTLNLTLVDMADFDIDKLKEYFDPKYFFVKLSPINENAVSRANNLGAGVLGGADELLG